MIEYSDESLIRIAAASSEKIIVWLPNHAQFQNLRVQNTRVQNTGFVVGLEKVDLMIQQLGSRIRISGA